MRRLERASCRAQCSVRLRDGASRPSNWRQQWGSATEEPVLAAGGGLPSLYIGTRGGEGAPNGGVNASYVPARDSGPPIFESNPNRNCAAAGATGRYRGM